MTDKEIKLECFNIALELLPNYPVKNILILAERLSDFCFGLRVDNLGLDDYKNIKPCK